MDILRIWLSWLPSPFESSDIINERPQIIYFPYKNFLQFNFLQKQFLIFFSNFFLTDNIQYTKKLKMNSFAKQNFWLPRIAIISFTHQKSLLIVHLMCKRSWRWMNLIFHFHFNFKLFTVNCFNLISSHLSLFTCLHFLSRYYYYYFCFTKLRCENFLLWVWNVDDDDKFYVFVDRIVKIFSEEI